VLETLLHDGGMNTHANEQLNLAKQACDLGDVKAAESFYERALEEVEGGEVSDLATVLYELQKFYSTVGDKEKARLMARRFRVVAVHYCYKQSGH